jgi:hypothetical protein
MPIHPQYLLLLLAIAAVPSVISGVYLFAAPKSASVARRIAGSLHGVVIGLLAAYVYSQGSASRCAQPRLAIFLVILAAPPLLVALSFKVFRGKRSIHGLQIINGFWYLNMIAFGGFILLCLTT